MDKQQEQMKQNPNQEVKYTSGFLDEEEEVNESEFDEPTGEQGAGKLADNQQNKPKEEEKPKRPRKTIEQEIAELDAKRERLMEKKRRQEAHEKIVFGATVIAMLKNMRKSDDPMFKTISDKLKGIAKKGKGKDFETIEKIIAQILEIKIESSRTK